MAAPRPHRENLDERADLRLAAMVAEHERRKWSIVTHVIGVLSTLGDRLHAGERDGRPEGRGQ